MFALWRKDFSVKNPREGHDPPLQPEWRGKEAIAIALVDAKTGEVTQHGSRK